MVIKIKDAKEKLGDEKFEELVDKDWKVAELPSEEELQEESHVSPKARNHPNSRKNLVQYNKKKSKETKKKILDNLKYTEKEEDVVPRDILGDLADIIAIEKLMPSLDILADRAEQEVYYNYINLITSDFDPEELTSSDIDDIITMALNRVIEYRLLKAAKKNPSMVLDAAPTIERFRKFSEKAKIGLASRRSDRIDVKNKPAFSIVNLASHLDEQEKLDYDIRIKELEKERKQYKVPERDADGFLVKAKKDA